MLRGAFPGGRTTGGFWLVLVLFVFAACQQEPASSRPVPSPTAETRSPDAPASTSVAVGDLPPFPSRFPAAERLVAIGDLHGDLSATRAALKLAGLLGDDGRWSGGQSVLVQVGDVLDRGDSERAILELFEQLAGQAAGVGGRVHVLNGNHELMNVAGDLRYVTPGGFREFADLAEPGLDDSALGSVPAHQRARLAAFRPGGKYARKLADHPVVLLVGRSLFVHGGILPSHVRYGLERINQEMRAWLLGQSLRGRRLVARRDSPVWDRSFSGPPPSVDCARLQEALELAGADRMVVGHTPHKEGITAACNGRIWRIDVGLAAFYGGPLEVLEIGPQGARPLRVEESRP